MHLTSHTTADEDLQIRAAEAHSLKVDKALGLYGAQTHRQIVAPLVSIIERLDAEVSSLSAELERERTPRRPQDDDREAED